MKMSIRTTALTLALLVPVSAPLAAIKCWTNKDGLRECGNAVPPEYAQKETRTLDKRGITVEVQERAKTAEEVAEQQRLEAAEREREAEEKRLRAERAAADRVLLATFATEQDIITSRDRKLAAVEGLIEVTRLTVGNLEQNLEQEKKRAASHERAGRPIPDDLTADMASLQRQIEEKQAYIHLKQREMEELRTTYDADLQRFRELQSKRRQ